MGQNLWTYDIVYETAGQYVLFLDMVKIDKHIYEIGKNGNLCRKCLGHYNKIVLKSMILA